MWLLPINDNHSITEFILDYWSDDRFEVLLHVLVVRVFVIKQTHHERRGTLKISQAGQLDLRLDLQCPVSRESVSCLANGAHRHHQRSGIGDGSGHWLSQNHKAASLPWTAGRAGGSTEQLAYRHRDRGWPGIGRPRFLQVARGCLPHAPELPCACCSCSRMPHFRSALEAKREAHPTTPHTQQEFDPPSCGARSRSQADLAHHPAEGPSCP